MQPVTTTGKSNSADRRDLSGALPPEWRLQALVVACNVWPLLLIALVIAYVSLVVAVPTGLFSLFVGGLILFFLLCYALLCLLTAGALYRRRAWARFTALGVFLLYLLLHAWAGSVKSPEVAPVPAYLRGQSAYILPAWVTGTWAFVDATMRLLPYLNVIALGHLLLRWRQFSKAAQ